MTMVLGQIHDNISVRFAITSDISLGPKSEFCSCADAEYRIGLLVARQSLTGVVNASSGEIFYAFTLFHAPAVTCEAV